MITEFRPRVYVAGKYTAPTAEERLANTRRAMEIGLHLYKKGYAPFIPHLTHFADELATELDIPMEYKDWVIWDDAFQETCHLFFYDSASKGADREHRNAVKIGQPVFRRLEDVPHASNLIRSLQSVPTAMMPWENGRSFPLEVMIKRLPHAEGLPLPQHQTDGAGAFDLCAAIANKERLYPGETKMVPTGYCVALPKGCAGLVLPRSGLACKSRISLANSPGLVDSDFRGELLLSLTNFGASYFNYERGMRLAQFLLISTNKAVFNVVASLPPTGRGEGGFGHTGVR